jgi:hypothetical protein
MVRLGGIATMIAIVSFLTISLRRERNNHVADPAGPGLGGGAPFNNV